MINVALRGIPVPGGGRYGDSYTGVVYGQDYRCMRCGSRHDDSQSLRETDRTQSVTARIVNKMTQWMRSTTTTLNLGEGCMVGVLITDTNFYTACSSGNGQPLRQLFDSAVGQITVPALTVCNDINFGRLKNRGASTITHQEVSLCQRIPASPVGVCAAPKMIHAAIQNGDSGTWVMSEIFYNPALDLNRPHQETIQSCPNCARLLPMMMCSDIPLSDFRGSLQSATRGQYMPG